MYKKLQNLQTLSNKNTHLTLKALNFFMETLKTEVFFQFENIMTVLVGSYRFI